MKNVYSIVIIVFNLFFIPWTMKDWINRFGKLDKYYWRWFIIPSTFIGLAIAILFIR